MVACGAADGEKPIDDVISFGTDEISSSVKIVTAGRFGPRNYEPPGVAYSKVDETNVYHRTYDRVYSDGSMLWRLKTMNVSTMQNGDVGEAGNLAFYHALFEGGHSPSHPKSQTLKTAVVVVPYTHASLTA